MEKVVKNNSAFMPCSSIKAKLAGPKFGKESRKDVNEKIRTKTAKTANSTFIESPVVDYLPPLPPLF